MEQSPGYDLDATIRKRRSIRMFLRDRPVPRQLIDESIELSRAYAGDEAATFVNGVLGHVARERV